LLDLLSLLPFAGLLSKVLVEVELLLELIVRVLVAVPPYSVGFSMLFGGLLHQVHLVKLTLELFMFVDSELLQVTHGEQGVGTGCSRLRFTSLNHDIGWRGDEAGC